MADRNILGNFGLGNVNPTFGSNIGIGKHTSSGNFGIGKSTQSLKDLLGEEAYKKVIKQPKTLQLPKLNLSVPEIKISKKNQELIDARDQLRAFGPTPIMPISASLDSRESRRKRAKEAGTKILEEERGKTLGVQDVLQEVVDKPSKLVPFLSGAVEIKELAPILVSAGKLKAGTATDEDIANVKNWYEEELRKSQSPKTFGYKVGQVIKELPSFAGELLLTGGIATAANKATIKTGKEFLKSIVKKGGKELLEESIGKATKKTLKRKAVEFGTKAIGATAGEIARTPVSGLTRIPAAAIQKMLPKEIDVGATELNKIILKEGDDAFTALKKATGEQFIENLSEVSGGAFSKIIPKSVKNKLIKSSFIKAFTKKNPTAKEQVFKTLWKKAGWNGIFEEFGEERLGEIGHAVFNKAGLSDQEYQFPTMDEMAIELAAFAITGAGLKSIQDTGGALGLTTKDVSGVQDLAETARNEDMDKETFLKKYNEDLVSKDKAVRNKAIDVDDILAKQFKTTPEKFYDKYVAEGAADEVKVEAEITETPEEKIIREAIAAEPIIKPSGVARDIKKTISPKAPKVAVVAPGAQKIESKTKTDIALRKKLRAEQKTSKVASIARGKVEAEKQKATTARQKRVSVEKIVDIKRKNSLDKLRQRIKDREKVTKQKGKVEDLKSEMSQMKGIRNGIIEYSKRYLPKEIRSKVLTKSFMNAKKIDKLKSAVRKIDVWAKQNRESVLRTDILSSLKATKPKRKFGKPAGRFTADVQYPLTVYRESVGMTEEEASDKIQQNIEKGTKNPFQNVAVENLIISRASGMKNKKEGELKDILGEINTLKETGRLARDIETFNRASENERTTEKVIDVITGGKGIDPATKSLGVQQSDKMLDKIRRSSFTTGTSQMGMQDVANILSSKDKTSEEGKSILNEIVYTLPQYNNYNTNVRKKSLEIRADIKKSYNLEKDRDIDKKIAENSKKEFLGSFDNKKGVSIPLELSKDEAMKSYAIMQNEKLKEAMMHEDGMAYTEEMIDAVDSFLTEEDKKLVDEVFDFNKDFYKDINNVFRKMSGVDLPFEDKYVTVRREIGGKALDDINLENNTKDIFSISKASLKDRVENLRTIKTEGLIQSQLRHITEMQHYISYAEKVRELNSIFDNEDVKNAIDQEYGGKASIAIKEFRKDLARGGIDASKKLKKLDQYLSNYTFAQLAIKPKQIATQLTSLFTYADEIPLGAWGIGLADFMTDPITKGKELYSKSEYLQNRGMNIDKDMQNIARSDEYALVKKNRSFRNILMLNTQIGDKGAIIIGGYPVYSYHKNKALKEGKSTSEAEKIGIEEFEKATDLTQQSSQIATLSQMQKMGSLGRLFTAFKSSPNLFLRKEIGALRALISGKISLAKFAKTIAIYHFLMPMLYQLVSDGFRWDPDEQKRAATVGSFNGMFIVGDGLKYIIKKALNQKTWALDDPLTGEIARVGDAVGKIDPLTKIFTDDTFTVDDIQIAAKQLLDTGGKVSGLPSDAVLKGIGAGSKTVDGEYAQAIMMMSGWSKFQAEKKAKSLKKKKKKKTSGVDFEGLDLEDLDFEDLNLEDIDLGDLDFGELDFGEADFGDIYFGDLDFDNLDLSDLDF